MSLSPYSVCQGFHKVTVGIKEREIDYLLMESDKVLKDHVGSKRLLWTLLGKCSLPVCPPGGGFHLTTTSSHSYICVLPSYILRNIFPELSPLLLERELTYYRWEIRKRFNFYYLPLYHLICASGIYLFMYKIDICIQLYLEKPK